MLLLLGGVLMLAGCDLLYLGGGGRDQETAGGEATEAASPEPPESPEGNGEDTRSEAVGEPPAAPEPPREAETDTPALQDESSGEWSESSGARDPLSRDPLWRVDADGEPVKPVAIRGDCVQYEDGTLDCDLLQRLVDDALAGRELSSVGRWLLEEAASEPPAESDDESEDDEEPQAGSEDDDESDDDDESEDDEESEDEDDESEDEPQADDQDPEGEPGDDPRTESEDEPQADDQDPEGEPGDDPRTESEDEPQADDQDPEGEPDNDPEPGDDPQTDDGGLIRALLDIRVITEIGVTTELLTMPASGRFLP